MLPDEITFTITPDDVRKSMELAGTNYRCATCVVATAVNRWLTEASLEGQAWVNSEAIEIYVNPRPTVYHHSKESMAAMAAFDKNRPVQLCTTTIKKRSK